MGTNVGYPFGGSVWFTQEASYGGGHNGAAHRFSDAVQVCRIESGDINAKLRHIGDSRVTDYVRTLVNPRLHVEYVWQPHFGGSSVSNGSCVSDFVKRTTCDLQSFCVEFGASEGCTGDDSYYMCKGAVCDSLNFTASTGEYYMITLDFSLSSVVTSGTVSATPDPGEIGEATFPFASFNNAGNITWSMGADTYYVTKSLDVTINNNLNDYWDVGSVDKKTTIPGGKDVTGNMDISMDGGGAIHWGFVTGGNDIADVQFNAGSTSGSAFDVITLTGGRFDSTAIENNVSGEGMFDSVPFTFKDLTFSTVTV